MILGGVIFIEYGIDMDNTVVFEPGYNQETHQLARIYERICNIYEGKVRKRPEGTENPQMPPAMLMSVVDKLFVLILQNPFLPN